MDVVVSPEARSFAAGRGGIVYVRSHSHRCCAGPLTLLDTTTEAPRDSIAYVELPAGDLMVRYCGDPEAGPHVLTIALRVDPTTAGRLLGRLRLQDLSEAPLQPDSSVSNWAPCHATFARCLSG